MSVSHVISQSPISHGETKHSAFNLDYLYARRWELLWNYFFKWKISGVEGNNWKNKLEHQCTSNLRDQCTSLSSSKPMVENPRMFCQYRCCNETPTRMGMSSCDWSKDCHVYQDKFLCFYKNSADGSIKNVMWQWSCLDKFKNQNILNFKNSIKIIKFL